MFSSVCRVVLVLPILVLLPLAIGCSGGGSPGFAHSSAGPEPGRQTLVSDERPDHLVSSGAHEGSGAVEPVEANWGYEGIGGPLHWGSISTAYGACSEGNRQSPIDLATSRGRDLSPIGFSYRPAALSIVNNGHTIQVGSDGNSHVSIGRWPYRLRQFHFHSPSEHTIDGWPADIEMHLVHQDEQGRLAVIGVMIESGEYNPAFGSVWERLPSAAGDPEIFEEAFIDPERLLPDDRNFYHYTGSLTTPPCTEGVSWYVMSNAITMSPEQIAEFREIIDGNNRPVQERNGRVLYSTSR